MKQDTTAQRTPRYLVLVAAVTLAVAAVDQLVKQLMLNWLEPGVPQPVIGDWFRFYRLFTAIQLAFVLGALWFGPRMTSKWEALGLALVAGGALGNLTDRLFRDPGFWFGHVVDYISVGNFAVFNLADASITVGVVVFILGTLAAEMKGGDHGR